jgi:hypothetical protein
MHWCLVHSFFLEIASLFFLCSDVVVFTFLSLFFSTIIHVGFNVFGYCITWIISVFFYQYVPFLFFMCKKHTFKAASVPSDVEMRSYFLLTFLGIF